GPPVELSPISPWHDTPLRGGTLGLFLPLELAVIECGKDALPAHELGKRALLDDTPVLQHYDQVGVLHRGQPMRDDEGRAAGHEPAEALHDERLGFGIDCGCGLVED